MWSRCAQPRADDDTGANAKSRPGAASPLNQTGERDGARSPSVERTGHVPIEHAYARLVAARPSGDPVTGPARIRPFVKPSRTEAAKAWRELIALAQGYARRVAQGRALSAEEEVLFKGRIVRVTLMPFPLPYASATLAVEAFARAARGFATAAREEEREALGALMGAGALCLEQLLVADARRAMHESLD